jgi:hypothetical protein
MLLFAKAGTVPMAVTAANIIAACKYLVLRFSPGLFSNDIISALSF